MASDTQTTPYGALSASLNSDRLADLCLADGVQTGPFGSQLHQEDYVEDGTPIITVEHLGENRIVHQDLPRVSEEDKQRLAKYSLRTGDIVFSRVGSVDRRAIVREAENGWLFSGRCLRVRPNPEKLDPLWLSYFFGLSAFKQYIRGIAVGATMPSINTKILSDVPIYFPELDQQRHTAKLLASLDDKIEINRRINQTLEAMAQAIFKSWFVDFDPVKAKITAIEQGEDPLRAAMRAISGKTDAELAQMPREHHDQLAATATLFPDEMEESELGEIPKGWEVWSILDVCDLLGGAQPSASEFIQDDRVGYVRLLQIRDFSNDNHITYVPDNKKLRLANEDDVLIGRYGSASGNKEKDSLGRICRGKAGAYNVALMKLVPIKAGIEFCAQIFSSRDFYNYLQGASNKAVQAGFSKNEIKQYKTVLPSNELIGTYENFARSVWFSQKERNKESHNLSSLRDTLLPKLLSGELSVENFATEAAH